MATIKPSFKTMTRIARATSVRGNGRSGLDQEDYDRAKKEVEKLNRANRRNRR